MTEAQETAGADARVAVPERDADTHEGQRGRPAPPEPPPPDQGGPDDADQPAAWRVTKRVLGYGVLLTFAFAFFYPFMLALVTSLKTRPDAAQNPLSLIPDPLTFRVYTEELAGAGIGRAAFVSFVSTAAILAARVFLDSLAGYALARVDFPGRRVVFAVIVATLAIPPIVLAIPRFLVLGVIGLLNSWGGLIIPLAVDAFGIFLMKQFFESIPKEMEEAARIDGANIFTMYLRIVMPLAAPGVIALTILSFQGAWNEFLTPLIVVSGEPDLWPLPLRLAQLRGTVGENLDFPLLLGASILTTIPVAIIFFTFQRYFVQGVAAAGVKG